MQAESENSAARVADGSGPISIESTGMPTGKDCKQCYNAFPQVEVTYHYPDGVTLITSSKGENGVLFEGENGTIFVSRGEIRASDPKLLEDPLPSGATKLYVSNNHQAKFVDCIRTRKETICTAEIGHRSVSVCHLGNISLRLGGKKLEWDPKKESFKGDKVANAMLKRHQREGYTIS